MNLSLLVSCLEKMGKYYWADQLNRIENLDRGACFDGQNSVKNAASKTKPSSRFNLDPENPGTILIFNVVDYCDKVIFFFYLILFFPLLFNNKML